MKEFSSLQDKNFEFLILLSLFSKTPIEYRVCDDVCNKKEFLDLFIEFSKDSSYVVSKDLVKFFPGKLDGGDFCYKVKNICKVTIPLIIFGLFCKDGINIEMEGVTNQSSQIRDYEEKTHTAADSIDILKIIFMKIAKKIGIEVGIEVKKRGFDPEGEGIVNIKVERIREINRIYFEENELFYKIRGLVVTSKISADFTHRMIDRTRQILKEFNDVKISNILNNRRDSGPSPGYECSLYAESKNGIVSSTVNSQKSPESMAEDCCKKLFKKIDNGRMFDESVNKFLIIVMAMGKGVSYLRLNKICVTIKELLDFIKEFLNVEYSIVEKENNFILKIIGIGYINSARNL